jgi:hypothetical protein
MSPGKIPTGYVKIEVKTNRVKLNAFIQNVRVEDGTEYRLILVASGKNKAVDVGKIIIDSSGRGEISHELESDNVLKSGLHIADFNVAAVTSGTSIPLSGYTGRDKLEWKGKYEIVNRQKEKEAPRIDKKITVEEIVPEIPEPVTPMQPPTPIHYVPEPVIEQPAPAPMPEPKPVPAPKPEVTVEEVPVKEPEMPVEIPAPVEEIIPEPVEITPEPQPEIVVPHIHESKVEVKIVMPECPPLAPMEEPCEMEKKKIEKKKIIECEDIYYCDDEEEDECCSDSDEKKHHHHKYHVWKEKHRGIHERIKKVLRRLRRCEPFEEERGYDWFKVGENICEINSVTIPYMGYMVPMGYPFMSEGCSMMIGRKDYIIGVKYEDEEDDDDRRLIKYILFGVPAIYSKRNEQYYRIRGFMAFKPHKYKSYGYFIMCLDLGSGMLCHMD